LPDSTRHARLAIAQDLLTHIGRGDLGKAANSLSEKVVYTAHGNNALSGSYTGPEEVAAHLLRLTTMTESTFESFKWDDWLVGEHHVAGMTTVHAHAAGRKYSGHHVLLVTFNSADKIEGITVFFENQGAIDRFIGPK